jgi:molecular chaperone GrpE (heat shock protein)
MAEESAKNRETKDIKTVLEVADSFEKASEQLKKMELKDPKLTEYQQGLAEVYQGNADTTRSFVKALETKELAQFNLMELYKDEFDLNK